MTLAVPASAVEVSVDTVDNLPDTLVADDGTVFVRYQDNIYLVFDDGRDTIDGFDALYDYYDVYIWTDGKMLNANTMDEYAGQFRLGNALLYMRTGPGGNYVYNEDYYIRCWLSWPSNGTVHTQQVVGGRVVFDVLDAYNNGTYYFRARIYLPNGNLLCQDLVRFVVPTVAGATSGDSLVVPDGYRIELSTYGWTITADNCSDLYNSSNYIVSYWLAKDEPSVSDKIDEIIDGTTATELPTDAAADLGDLDDQLSSMTPTLGEWDDDLPGDGSASNLFAYLYESTWVKQMFLTVSVVALCAFVFFGRYD